MQVQNIVMSTAQAQALVLTSFPNLNFRQHPSSRDQAERAALQFLCVYGNVGKWERFHHISPPSERTKTR